MRHLSQRFLRSGWRRHHTYFAENLVGRKREKKVRFNSVYPIRNVADLAEEGAEIVCDNPRGEGEGDLCLGLDMEGLR